MRFAICRSFFLASALAAVTTLAAAQTLPVAAAHPLVGLWRSTVVVAAVAPGTAASAASPAQAAVAPPVSCTETMDFRRNQIVLGTSGAEITRATYDVSARPSAAGFYRLAQTILEANGRPDCAGDLHSKTDDTLVRFVQFSPQNDQFIVCQSASLAACFGPFRRQVN